MTSLVFLKKFLFWFKTNIFMVFSFVFAIYSMKKHQDCDAALGSIKLIKWNHSKIELAKIRPKRFKSRAWSLGNFCSFSKGLSLVQVLRFHQVKFKSINRVDFMSNKDWIFFILYPFHFKNWFIFEEADQKFWILISSRKRFWKSKFGAQRFISSTFTKLR